MIKYEKSYNKLLEVGYWLYTKFVNSEISFTEFEIMVLREELSKIIKKFDSKFVKK